MNWEADWQTSMLRPTEFGVKSYYTRTITPFRGNKKNAAKRKEYIIAYINLVRSISSVTMQHFHKHFFSVQLTGCTQSPAIHCEEKDQLSADYYGWKHIYLCQVDPSYFWKVYLIHLVYAKKICLPYILYILPLLTILGICHFTVVLYEVFWEYCHISWINPSTCHPF